MSVPDEDIVKPGRNQSDVDDKPRFAQLTLTVQSTLVPQILSPDSIARLFYFVPPDVVGS